MAYDNNNTGIISKNTRKEKPTHPDINGRCTIDGVEFWVSGWAKTGSRGPFYTLAFQKKEKQIEQRSAPATSSSDIDDEIPF